MKDQQLKRVLVKRAPDNLEVLYAVNAAGDGLFTRFPDEGAWRQLMGTTQHHSDSRHGFASWLRDRGIIASTADVIESFGWD